MTLARAAGITASPVTLTSVGPRPVLLVKRFDRTPEGHRKHIVTAETVLRTSDARSGAPRSYVALASEVRSRFADSAPTLRNSSRGSRSTSCPPTTTTTCATTRRFGTAHTSR